MKPLRWVAGGVVWLVGGVVAALGVLLCATIVLLPLGIPLLRIARRLLSLSVRLVLPRAVVHPVDELLAKATGHRRHLGLKRMKKRARRIRKRLRAA